MGRHMEKQKNFHAHTPDTHRSYGETGHRDPGRKPKSFKGHQPSWYIHLQTTQFLVISEQVKCKTGVSFFLVFFFFGHL